MLFGCFSFQLQISKRAFLSYSIQYIGYTTTFIQSCLHVAATLSVQGKLQRMLIWKRLLSLSVPILTSMREHGPISQIAAFLSVPLLVIEDDGNQRTLPARPLYADFSLGSGRMNKAWTELIQKSFQKFNPFREGISLAFRVSGSSTARVVHFRSASEGLRLHNIWKENLSRSEALSKETLRSSCPCQPGAKHFLASAAGWSQFFLSDAKKEKHEGAF